MKKLEKIVAIVGPTASGKSDIAVKVAKILGGEIISADSRLVYKDFNIGTAKPSIKEQEGILHYMLDIAEPQEQYTVGRYQQEADLAIKEILAKGKMPIVAGGTGFYVRALLDGLDMPKVEPDEEYRKELETIVKTQGKEVLHALLKEVDIESSEKLHPNDTFRIIRALEVYKVLGIKMSEAQKLKKPDYDVIYIGLNAEDRDFLYERINKRVDLMLEQGLLDEVETLIHKYGKTVPLMKTLGYKEICEYKEEKISLNEAIELIKKNTRNFAKRQLTWFRANKNIHWFFIDKQSKDEICKNIIELIKNE